MEVTPKRERIAIAAGFFILTVLTRLALADTALFNIDSVNFALALDKFDVALHQPHPPGYFLYVILGRVARLITGDADAALVSLSAIFSAMTVSLLYIMGSSMYGRREGISAALIALTSPLFWFHGIVALSYATEGFLSLLIAWLCWRTLNGEGRYLWLSAVALGIGGGFRQTTIVFLAPLWFYSIRRQGMRRVLAALGLLGVSFLSWFIPMLHLAGGYGQYLDAAETQVNVAVWRGISLSNILDNIRAQSFNTAWGLLAALAPLVFGLLPHTGKKASLPDGRDYPAFYFFWLAPSVAFYILIMSAVLAPGYGLVYMVGLFLLAGKFITTDTELFSRETPGIKSGTVWAVMVSVILTVNTLAFFYMSSSFSYKGLNHINHTRTSYLDGLKKYFPPKKTVVVGYHYVYLNARHVAYYLPEYLVYDLPSKRGSTGRYYFRSQGRKTEKSPNLTVPEDTEFLVYFIPRKTPLSEAEIKAGALAVPLGEGNLLIYFNYKDLKGSGAPIDKLLMDMNG